MLKNISLFGLLVGKLLIIIVILFSLFHTSNLVYAQDSSTEEPPAQTGFDVFAGPNSETFRKLNPFYIAESPYENSFKSPAGIINRLLLYLYPITGLILFLMLVWGGFEVVINAHNSKAMEKGRQRITMAIVGFFLFFSSFWIIQIVEYIFGLAIL